jgi:hypothetical protein
MNYHIFMIPFNRREILGLDSNQMPYTTGLAPINKIEL